MPVAPDSNPAASFTPFPRLAANLASAGGFHLACHNALINGIAVMTHDEAQCPELLLDLHYREARSGLLLKLRDHWLQVGAQPPKDFKPAVAALESERHLGVAGITVHAK